VQKPSTWRGTVRHEFLHAIGFHHSHQNMRGPCQASFRWDDDPDYEPTRDARGAFVADHNGRRPGIYTFLAGFSNFWSRQRIDFNLRTEDNSNLIAGPFDRHSVMLYRFPRDFYKTHPNSCSPLGNGQSLSDGDKRGLQLLYPKTETEIVSIVEAQKSILGAIEAATHEAASGLESGPPPGSAVLRETAAAFRVKLHGL
jgi:hypothetical protein